MSTPAFEQYPFDIAWLSEEEGKGCVITFPDLPGCIADGASEETAIAQARDAFQAWITSMAEDGKSIPLPGSAAGTDSSDALSLEQRARIRANIRARGMTFEVFLPEPLANWLREKIAAGVYRDAQEAAYLAFQDLRELDRHPEVRRELLSAMIKDGLKDSGRTYSPEEVRAELRAMRREYANTEPPTANASQTP